MKQRILLVLLSIALLSIGWLGLTGFTLLVALVPLLLISDGADDSRRGWWSTFWWALAIFVGWNVATVWWIGNATLIGPVAATLFSTFYSMVGFMLYHTVSKRAPRALAYTLLVSLWIALERYYLNSDISWPWLLLGNGFSHDVWAVQWYEYTGIFGGALWVLLSNIFLFEALRKGFVVGRFVRWCVVVLLPLIVSATIYFSYSDRSGEWVEVAIIQPNVDSYDRTISDREIEHIILDLVGELPASVDLVVLSETIMPRYYWESAFDSSPFVGELRDSMSARGLSATVVVGANTMVPYYGGEHPYTARPMRGSQSIYYDLFNTAAAISIDDLQLRHKSKLVIGVERTPKWLLDIFELLSVDMGSITVGQIGQGGAGESFDVDGVRVGAAVCYEGLYGEFFGDFVRDGAQIMTIISNDCWWDNTPGYRHLYSLSALRAVEYRRPIARCANTGISGYIDERGVSLESMAWGERGVMIRTIVPNDELTFYAKNCDLLGRVALLLAALSLLYYVSYRVRKRHYLVD